MKFVIATGNEGKLREFKRILEPMGLQAVSVKQLPEFKKLDALIA